jgi:hypothetical protein
MSTIITPWGKGTLAFICYDWRGPGVVEWRPVFDLCVAAAACLVFQQVCVVSSSEPQPQTRGWGLYLTRGPRSNGTRRTQAKRQGGVEQSIM